MCTIIQWFNLVLLGASAIMDLRKKEIPLVYLVSMSLAAVCECIFCREVALWLRLAGCLVGILFLVAGRFTKEAIGYGDGWMIAILGLQLGLRRQFEVLLFASLLSGVVALLYLWKRGWKRTGGIPFVPYLWIVYVGAMWI